MRRDPFDAPGPDLKRQITRGALSSGIAQGVRLLAQIGTVVILSRLLPPAEFGIVAMAAPVLALVLLFQEFGIAQAIIQKQVLTRAEVATLFWIAVALSAAFALALILAAPLVARFYGEPNVGLLTAAMAANALVAGVGAQHIALLNRGMRFGMLATLDTMGAVAGLAVGVAWAWYAPSFWAIYAGSLVTTVVPALGAWVATGWIPSLPARGTGARSSLHFGAGVAGFNVANFFARNLDKVLIGRVWGEIPLGLYDRAYKLMLFPTQQVNAPLSRVMLPALSRMADEPPRYRYAFLRAMNQILMLSLPGIAFMTASAAILVPFLLGEDWHGAVPIFAALGLAGILQPLNNPCGWLFVSQARTWEFMRWGLFNAVTCILGFVIGLPYGAVGVAVVYAIGEIIRTPLLWLYATRKGPIRRRDAVSLALPHILGALAALAVVHTLVSFVNTSPVVLLAMSAMAAYAAAFTVIAAFPQGRAALGESAALLTTIVGKSLRHAA